MTFHREPADDAWKQVTIAHAEAIGRDIWVFCNACQHDRVLTPSAFAAMTGAALDEPLLSIARRLRCSRCGELKAQVAPSPHGHRARTLSC